MSRVVGRAGQRGVPASVLALAAALSMSSAWSQAPGVGRIVPTPAELAPKQSPATDPRAMPELPVISPRELGKPEDELTLDVTGFALAHDAPPALRTQLARLTAPYVGTGKSYEDLVNAAAEVTRFLQRDIGDYLGYAYIPAQVPKDGIVQVAVLEGRLDRVVLNWPDDLPVRRDVVEAYLAHLQPGAVLRVQDVERVVFLVNDLRGISVRFEVKAGATPGTALLMVTGRAEPRWAANVQADVNGSRFLGVGRIGGLLSGNSLLGRGDALTLTALSSTSGGLQFVLASYTTPVGSSGVKLGASVSQVHYKIDEAQFSPTGSQLGLQGSASTGNVFALYPWVRSRNLNVFAVTSLEHKRYDDLQLGLKTPKHTDSLSLGATGDFRDSLLTGAVDTYEFNVAAGQVRYANPGQVPLADNPNYSKLLLAFSRLQNVVNNQLLLYLALRGQMALSNLDTTEQFRLGGPDGIRAFAPGEGTGDSGAMLTAELRLLPPESWFGRLSREMAFSVFYDAGQVQYRHDPNRGATGTIGPNWAAYSGAGLALAWVRPGDYALRASLATALTGKPVSDSKVMNPRLYAQFTKFF